MDPLIEAHRKEIVALAARHGALNVRLFGSRAREQGGPASDVDLLVETAERTAPWFPAGLIEALQDRLGCRVEVVTERALHPAIRQRVLKEAVPL